MAKCPSTVSLLGFVRGEDATEAEIKIFVSEVTALHMREAFSCFAGFGCRSRVWSLRGGPRLRTWGTGGVTMVRREDGRERSASQDEVPESVRNKRVGQLYR